MKAIITDTTNLTLLGNGDDIGDLPVTRHNFDGYNSYESCYELSPEEIEYISRTGKIYLNVIGSGYPPTCISLESMVEQEE